MSHHLPYRRNLRAYQLENRGHCIINRTTRNASPVRRLTTFVGPLPSLSLLLIIAGVECNLGLNSTCIHFYFLNVRYATKKAAVIHELIDANNLDTLAMA